MTGNPAPLSRLALILALVAAGPALATGKGKPARKAPAETATPAAPVNDFPTKDRVEYVWQCMAERGGANLDNMYHCVCAVDKIASLMNFQDYSESLTYTYMYDTPGDKGGEFRDPPRSKELRERLRNARKAAEFCFPTLPGKSGTPAPAAAPPASQAP